jgi:hypothetical protein
MIPHMLRLLPLLLLYSCSAPESGVKADLGRLRPWSADIASVQPLPPPFVADFEAGSRSLCYAAVEHSSEKESPSLTLLGQVMDNRRYGVVVLEGIPRSLGLNPRSLLDQASQDGKDGFFRNGETSVAIAHAQARKIPFVGAEPDEQLVRSAIEEAGYSANDLFGLYVLRLIPQWRRDGTLTRETFEEAYAEMSPLIGRRIGIAKDQIPTLAAFEKWYENRQGSPFHLRDVRPETASPVPDGATFSQRIAAITDRVRSEHILRVTEEMLNKFGHVLLVFQSAHFPVQEPALESMLGRPSRISDQP